jgi:transposase
MAGVSRPSEATPTSPTARDAAWGCPSVARAGNCLEEPDDRNGHVRIRGGPDGVTRRAIPNAGVDAHRTKTHVTIVDDVGKVLTRKRVSSSSDELQRLFAHYQEPIKAVVEATYNWGPVYDWLDEIADDVVLAHPAKVRAIAEARIKNDKIDSETLAQLLRADLIPQAYAPSKEIRAVKRVLRQRMFFVRVQTMVKNRIHALLAQHAIVLPDATDLYGKAGLAWLQQLALPQPDGQLLRDDLCLLATLRERIIATDALIGQLTKGDEVIGWLLSLPGIGSFFAVLLRYEVDDMTRFRSAKKFARYTGLIPSTYASNTRVYHGPLTKQGNKWLRWAFIEAVAPALRASSSLRHYHDRIKARRGAHDARVCTARKLAELAWTVWTERRCYAEERSARPSEKVAS